MAAKGILALAFAALTLAVPAATAPLPPKAPNLVKLLGAPTSTRTTTGSGYRWVCADWQFRNAIVTACYPVAKLRAAKAKREPGA